MKKLINGGIHTVSLVRSADIVAGTFDLSATSTYDGTKYEFGQAAVALDTYKDFWTVTIDLFNNEIPSGEYTFLVQPNLANQTRTRFLAVIYDSDKVKVGGAVDVYQDSVVL